MSVKLSNPFFIIRLGATHCFWYRTNKTAILTCHINMYTRLLLRIIGLSKSHALQFLMHWVDANKSLITHVSKPWLVNRKRSHIIFGNFRLFPSLYVTQSHSMCWFNEHFYWLAETTELTRTWICRLFDWFKVTLHTVLLKLVFRLGMLYLSDVRSQ